MTLETKETEVWILRLSEASLSTPQRNSDPIVTTTISPELAAASMGPQLGPLPVPLLPPI